MKPYRRNYALGMACLFIGLAIFLISPPGNMDTFGKILAGGGFILAGFSGSEWWTKER